MAAPAQAVLGLLLPSPLTEPLGQALTRLLGQRLTPCPCHCLSQGLDLGKEEKYPTWKRTLTRRDREAQMKRFCKAQVSPMGQSWVPIPSIPLQEVPAHG